MLTSYVDSLRECLGRRTALVLLGLAFVASILFCLLVKVRTLPDGSTTVSVGTLATSPNAFAVPAVLASIVGATGGLWILLAILVGAPLLTGSLEKGWFELIFSKGTSRSNVFLGRLAGCITLYFVSATVAVLPLAVGLWWKTGIGTWGIFFALLLQILSFAALLSVAALATLLQKGPALPVMGAAALWFFSPLLARREQLYYPLVSSHLGRGAIDWAYQLLPKCAELEGLCTSVIEGAGIASWWPIWSTGVFVLALLTSTVFVLERKSF